MKKLIGFSLLLAASFAQRPEARKYDFVIRNARIVDGTGNPWFAGDVAIRGERIVAVGRVRQKGKHEIDAAQRIIAPGFIDMHSHSDLTLLVDGSAEGKIRQGVTTEIVGEAGSAAPRCPEALNDEASETGPWGLKLRFRDFAGYFRELERSGIAVNLASYVGSGRLRQCAMGSDDRAPTAEELDKMKAMVGTAMRQGAIGLSTGLIYTPGSFAKTEELIELAKVAAQHGGLYASHMRDEGSNIEGAVNETIRIAEEAKIPVHILHFKVSGKKNWGKIDKVIAQINAARDRGVQITADQYPYIASSTGLTARIPQWTRDGGTPRLLERLRDPEVRKQIRLEMEHDSYPWERAIIARLNQAHNRPLEGKSIKDAAALRNQGKDEIDTVFDLLLEEKGSVGMVYFGMDEADVKLAMRQPWVSVGSDGRILRPDGVLGNGKPHPRNYGTFPRVLANYVREERWLSLEDAVRKMTSLAAQQMGFRDRGQVREGMKADLVMFDLANIKDDSTFNDPHHFAEGMDYVFVNGKPVLAEGKMTSARPGEVLRGPGYRQVPGKKIKP